MIWISVLIGYLLGSVNFSYIIAKKVAGIDIRDFGSGNAGATNTLRVLGKKAGIAVFVLDILKAMAAVGIGYVLTNDPAVMYASGFSAIIGHNWPIFFQFRGGKGVASTIGLTLLMVTVPALVVGAIAIVVVMVTRYISLGSLVFAIGLPFAVWLGGEPPAFIWISAAIAALIVVRHRSNIRRLLQGKENRLSQKRKTK